MKLISLSAKNYRTLHDINIPFSPAYCTVSGRNNAGKSCVIRLLQTLFRKPDLAPWLMEEFGFIYKEDKTQWHKPDDPIRVTYELDLNRDDDPALLTFISKITGTEVVKDAVGLTVQYEVASTEDIATEVKLDAVATDAQAAKEIVKKIQGSNLLFLYNSATKQEEIYYRRGRRRVLYDVIVSEDEKKQLDEAGKQMEKTLRRLTREHKTGLNSILGRLSEKYDVEFAPPEGYATRHMPLGITLRDKAVEVPLGEWGSGTQNRTHILTAVLQASRIKTGAAAEDRITPIVVIEEPESFLHPSAQSEFGRVLRTLAAEFGIQLIVTTHSPYMLNQETPSSNILLCRQRQRRRLLETVVVETTGENWMAPFAEHLGIDSSEFTSWRPVFSSYKSRVLLVEGPTDEEYFEYLQKASLDGEQLNTDIEVVAYGGKDTLKNTLLVKFVLGKFDDVFITCDLDAFADVRGSLERLGLREGKDYMSVGLNRPGRDAIEGLLPDRVLAAVNGRETDLVMRLGSKDTKDRRDAKDILKKKYLEEFVAHSGYTRDDLKELSRIVRAINARFGRPNKRVEATR